MRSPRTTSSPRTAQLLWAGLALLAPPAARGDVVQPDGETIPVVTNRLSAFLNGSANNDNINEGIDVVKDAAVDPQIFAPLCQFSGKYIAKGGGANFAIGWYNVDDARPSNMPPRYVPVDVGANLNKAAANSDIFILFPFASSLPPANMRDLSSASIRQDPAYKGGYIGLVLVPNPNGTGSANATQYHYTEHRFNVQCTRCAKPGPWYSHLTYKSKMLPNTFYLGFEDLDFRDLAGMQGVNGNDLDYEDFVFRFTGLACPGAGVPCMVQGGIGLCAGGITDCDAQGQLVCRPRQQPGAEPERCDGVDNDCNGVADDGAMCPTMKVCDRGVCVDPCGKGEFKCDVGLVCDHDVCIDPPCVGKTCPAGEVCRGGVCRGPCDGIVCPHGQECRAGRCVDPCAGVTCAMNQVCVGGVCIAGCACRPCAQGQACAMSGDCVEAACVNKMCGPGTYCMNGQCVDACTGATCPPGQECKMGACIALPMPDAGIAGDLAASTGDGGAAGDDGGEGGGGTTLEGGCGCRVGRAAGGRTGALSDPGARGAWIVVALVALLRRARRRRPVGAREIG